jgi:hypothetical protein
MFYFFFLLTAVLCAVPQDFVNKNLVQSVHVVQALVKTKTTIHIKALEESQDYLLAFGDEINHQAFISVGQKESKEQTPTPLTFTKQADHYKIRLLKPLKKDSETFLVIHRVFMDVIKPHPKVILQKDPQLLEFLGNGAHYSAYQSLRQKTTISIPKDGQFISFKPEPNEKSRATAVFGPYENVPAYKSEPVYIHFKDNNGVLVAVDHKKIVQVSHWANSLNVLEYYTIVHKGAEYLSSTLNAF